MSNECLPTGYILKIAHGYYLSIAVEMYVWIISEYDEIKASITKLMSR